MNKKKIMEKTIQTFPNMGFLRKKYNNSRIAYYSQFEVADKDVSRAEADPAQKERFLTEYAKRWPDYDREIEELIEEELDHAPVYRNRVHDEKLRQEMRFCRFAYGFKPDEFLCYNLENKSFVERNEFVSSRELMIHVYRMNDRMDIQTYNDKSKTYDYFKPYYKRDAISICDQNDFDKFRVFAEKNPVFVKKQVGEAMGRSVELIDTTAEHVSLRDMFEQLVRKGKHILEERLVQSERFSALNESSVNTVRCITYYTRDGVVIPYSFMKIGRAGSFVDNGGAGGILVGIDMDTGCLCTDGFDEFINRYEAHPDSGIRFKGYQLPDFRDALQLCTRLSAMTPTVKFVGWDITHTSQGWVVVEGNGMSQLIGPQIVFERGVKAEVDQIMQNMDLLV